MLQMFHYRAQSHLNTTNTGTLTYAAVQPFMGTLKLHSSGPIYSSKVIDTLAVHGWAVTFGTARKGLGGL